MSDSNLMPLSTTRVVTQTEACWHPNLSSLTRRSFLPVALFIFMFTPPPSPLPPDLVFESQHVDNLNATAVLPCKKKRIGRYFRVATVLLPLVAIICTTYLLHGRRTGHRPATDWLTVQDNTYLHGQHQYQLNRRHPSPQRLPVSSSPTSTTTSSDSQIPVSDQLVPTVPTTPPVLPTPFPQALDAGIVQNFSSSSCASFFANMTSAAPFRTCRPFSLLLGSSGAFINVRFLFHLNKRF